MRPFDHLTRGGRTRRLRAVARAALTRYDLELADLRLITAETNAVYRVDAADGRRFVLRVGLGGQIGHPIAQVGAELAWMQALHRDTDLLLPQVVANRDGTGFTVAEVPGVPDPRNCVLFTWVPGRVLGDNPGREGARALGELSARLHRHAAGYRPPVPLPLRYDRVFPFDEPVVLFSDESVPPALQPLLRRAAERVEDAIAALEAREPMRVLHGDLHAWNVLVSSGGLVPIDFEDLMAGWPVQDVATTLYYHHLHPCYETLRAAFRAGYERVLPWPDTTGSEVDTFIAGRALVLGNDVIVEPSWRAEAPAFFARTKRRLEDLLGGEAHRQPPPASHSS